MPSFGQRDSRAARAKLAGHLHCADAVDEDLGRRLGCLRVQVLRPRLDPPQAAPPHREFKVIAIRLAGLEEIKAAVVVEERQWKVRRALGKVETLVDSRELAVGILGAALVHAGGVDVGEVTGAEPAGTGDQRRRRKRHGERPSDDPRARQPRGPRRGSRAGVEPPAIGGEPRDHQQRDRIERAERHAVNQSAGIRRNDEVRGPDQQAGVAASSGDSHRVQNATSLCHSMAVTWHRRFI